MKSHISIAWTALGVLAIALAGCGGTGGQTAAPPPPASATTVPAATGFPASPVMPSPATPSIGPTRAPSPPPTAGSNSTAGPSWWPGDLPMPASVEYKSESDSDKPIVKRIAFWITKETDLDSLRDWFVKQARDSGYNVIVSPTTNGSPTYDLYFLKGAKAFELHILRLPSETHVDGNALETIQFKATGSVTQDAVLPVGILDARAGAPMQVMATLPNAQCATCRYAINISVAGFKGPGTYSAAQVQVNPGGDRTTGDYAHPANCTVVVKDELYGSFECHGLQSQADKSKTLELSGAWQAP